MVKIKVYVGGPVDDDEFIIELTRIPCKGEFISTDGYCYEVSKVFHYPDIEDGISASLYVR